MRSLGSSRGTSNGPDAVDVAAVLVAFEQMNQLRLIVTLRTCEGMETPDCWLEGKALSKVSVSGVRSLLAFASVRCGSTGLKTLDSAVLNLLYALDFQLAENELARTVKAAKPPPAHK